MDSISTYNSGNEPQATLQNVAKSNQNLGQRLLPHVVDYYAANTPNVTVGLIAKPNTNGNTPFEFTKLSISQFANAVNYTAHWLNKILGSGTHQIIGFVGLQDFRYPIMEVAAIKTGHVLLLPSPRNSISNTIHLMSATKCKTLLYGGAGSPIEDHVKALRSSMGQSNLEIHLIPTLEEMISTTSPSYPYTKSYLQASNDVVLILHTSGSTGSPKPIHITNAFIKRADCEHLIPTIPHSFHGDVTKLISPSFNGSPFFHLSGLVVMFRALFTGNSLLIGPPNEPVTAKTAMDIVRSVELRSVMAAPHVVDALFGEHVEELKEQFGKLENVVWFGGRLAQSTGDWIVKNLPHVHLWQFYGSTEMGWFPVLISPKSHWSYLEFHPDIGPHMEPVPNTDFYEVVIRRHPNTALAWSTPVFDIFPEKEEWRSRDLFKRCEDPGMEKLWKFEGRLDDILILNNALKVNPLHVEVKLQSHALLQGVMVFGEGKMRCGILLEPKQGVEKEGLVERVWEDIERANDEVPEHARVVRELAIVADEERPFVRAAKGTVVRGATEREYRREIEEVYMKAGNM